MATFSALSGSVLPKSTCPYSRPLGTLWLIEHKTLFPMSIFRKNSRASQAQGSSLLPGLVGPGLRAIRNGSISAKAMVRSGGGPFLGCPRIIMAPPSRTLENCKINFGKIRQNEGSLELNKVSRIFSQKLKISSK